MIITMELSDINGEKQIESLLTNMVASEYAIKITWGNFQSCAICFWKGDWTVCKYQGDCPTGYFEITDSGDVTVEDNLLRGLIESIRDIQKEKSADSWRKPYAETIIKVIGIWVGKLGSVKDIKVLLPGRNSIVREDGSIELNRKDW
jgi:hypothetical protein